MEEREELLSKLNERIKSGDDLIGQLQEIQNIDGVPKLQRKIRQEVEFLKRLQRSGKIKYEHLYCSNLRHFEAMVECSRRPGVIAVSKVFHLDNNTKLLVDIVSDGGKSWTKVIARNPKSLSALSSGKASYGARSILDQAVDYVECAKLYPCMYQTPKIIFELMSGIEKSLANKLKARGIIVKGEILPDFNNGNSYDGSSDDSTSEFSEDEFLEDGDLPITEVYTNSSLDDPEIDTLNLDVTAMMAYVSNMTNGHCNYVFKEHVLTQQCQWEAERPVKPILTRLFEGKTLVCCRTAWDDFEKIVNTLGGPQEMKRTAELKQMLKIYPDCYAGEDDSMRSSLTVRGHVRLRSKIIFNFGHRIKALTVSANDGFVRAALQQVSSSSGVGTTCFLLPLTPIIRQLWQQGITYATFIHESRALTEGKEAKSKMIL